MLIGVTGAFGFLGANFIARGFASGRIGPEDALVAFGSTRSDNPLLAGLPLSARRLDVRDAAAFAREARGLDLLVHFAGIVAYSRSRAREAWLVNVEGTRNAIAAARSGGVGRLVLVSSISALGESPRGRLGDEGAEPWGQGALSFARREEALAALDRSARGDLGFCADFRTVYFETKVAALELGRLEAARGGLDLVTVLPGTAVGAGDQHYALSRLVDGVYRNRLAATLAGESSFVDAEDFAEGAWLAAERGRSGGEYIVSGRDGHNLSYGDFMRLVAGVARSEGIPARSRFATLPRGLALAAATLTEPLGLEPSRGLVVAGSVVQRFTSAKAVRELGYAPSATLERGIRACRRFLEANRPGHGAAGRPGLRA